VEHFRPSAHSPAGYTIFDPTLSMVPRCAWAAFYTVCGAVVVYTSIDMYRHTSEFETGDIRGPDFLRSAILILSDAPARSLAWAG